MKNAVDVVINILSESRELGLRFLTFYLFSTTDYHNGKSVSASELKRIPLEIEPIETLKERIRVLEKDYEDMEIALSSEVLLDRAMIMHIPMVDLRGKDLKLFEEKLSVTGKGCEEFVPGSLVCSGKSYHYYGHRLLERDEWIKFLGICLICISMETGKKIHLADDSWIGHTMKRDLLGLLRIFERPGDEKSYRPEPYLAATLYDFSD